MPLLLKVLGLATWTLLWSVLEVSDSLAPLHQRLGECKSASLQDHQVTCVLI